MDGRLLNATENIIRDMYHLNESYVSTQCNIKANAIKMRLSNGLFAIEVTAPRDLIESNIECEIYSENNTNDKLNEPNKLIEEQKEDETTQNTSEKEKSSNDSVKSKRKAPQRKN